MMGGYQTQHYQNEKLLAIRTTLNQREFGVR
jgi:hypothetical protein